MTTGAITQTPERAGTGTRVAPRGVLFAVVAVALFMSSIDSTIVATALGTIHRSLHASINWAGWSITIYSLGMVVSLPVSGRISDQFGRRKVFFCGVALFTAASLACALASSIFLLIVFRAIQAIGGGALQPSAAGIVAASFGKDRDRAIGLFGTVASGGQVVGPVIGGLIVGYLSWRWIFFVNVPIGIVLLWAMMRVIPESRLGTKSRVDVRGLMLLAGFVFAATFGITQIGNRGTTFVDPIFLAPVLVGLVLLVLFVFHTLYSAQPFIPARLLKARGFAVMNIQNMGWGGVGFGMATLAPLYAEQRYGLNPLNAGTLLAARGVGSLAVGAMAALALRRTGYRMPLAFGFILVAGGMAMMAIAPHWGITPYLWLAVGAGITGVGNGAANPASRNACLQVAPEEVAAISGLRQMFIYIGIIFTVSTVTAILNRSPHPGLTQAHIMWVAVALLLLVMLPLVWRVPEHKGNW
ncbi:MAG: MFS transporter [Acidimicrobiaceae bacterium]|nr:MFS transporter [Acidimicrobiaceae bacterium]